MSWDDYADEWDQDEAARAYSVSVFENLNQLAQNSGVGLTRAQIADALAGAGLEGNQVKPPLRRFEDENGVKFYTAAYPHTVEELEACARAAGFAKGEIEDVVPSPELLERFPSRRAAGTPWLLSGNWTLA